MSAIVSVLLWGDMTCPYAERARITLIEKRVPFQVNAVESPSTNADYAALYKQASPGKPVVPLLQHLGKGESSSGVLLVESDVIAAYVDEEFKESDGHPSMMPVGTEQRAAVRLFYKIFLEDLGMITRKLITAKSPEMINEAADVIEKASLKLDELLRIKSPHGPFVAGEQFTLAEAITAPHLLRMIMLLSHREMRNSAMLVLLQRAASDHDYSDATNPFLLYLELIKAHRLRSWVVAVNERPSVVEAFQREMIVELFRRLTA
jgi:glutathione S-transferase